MEVYNRIGGVSALKQTKQYGNWILSPDESTVLDGFEID